LAVEHEAEGKAPYRLQREQIPGTNGLDLLEAIVDQEHVERVQDPGEHDRTPHRPVLTGVRHALAGPEGTEGHPQHAGAQDEDSDLSIVQGAVVL